MIDALKSGRCAVHVPTIEDETRLAELYEKVGWVWLNNKPLKENPALRWHYGDQVCIDLKDRFSWAGTRFYKENGWKIITVDEAEKRLEEMYPDKFKKVVKPQLKWTIRTEIERTDGLKVTEFYIDDNGVIYPIEEAQRIYLRLKSALNQHKKYFSKN